MDKQRNKNKSIADHTIEIIEKASFINPKREQISIRKELQDSIEGTICYALEMNDSLFQETFDTIDEQTTITVTEESTLGCVRRLKEEGKQRVLCLNFASARTPGGEFLGGSQAQEESIAKASGLYPSLLACKGYYQINKNQKSCSYTDLIIYTPETPTTRAREWSKYGCTYMCIRYYSIIC